MDSSSRPLRVFLCHSSGDKPIVREIYHKLDAENWLDPWLDEVKLLPGHDWNLEIERAVEAADVIIVCLSSNSVTKEGYVQRELKYALDIALEKPEGTIFVIPLRLDNCEPPRRLRGWQYTDYFPENLRPWAYQRVLESLKSRAKHLNLSTSAFESTPIPIQSPPSIGERQISQSATPYQYVSQNSKVAAPQQSIETKKINIWKYGRLMVLSLLILGFFGPWFKITSCIRTAEGSPPSEPTITTGPEAYSELISSKDLRVLIPSMVGVLFLLTAARLVRWRHQENNAIVRLERLSAGVAPLAMFIEMVNAASPNFGFSVSFLWGFWLSIVGNYLAPINILFEFRSTLQKGKKWPWWARLLMISLVLPWLVVLLFFLLLWVWSIAQR